MSILPPRTSPSPLPGPASAGDFPRSSLQLDPTRKISSHQSPWDADLWQAEWRVFFRDEASDPPVKETILRVEFECEKIRCELVDLRGVRLTAETFQVTRVQHVSGENRLIQWTVSGQPKPIARLMTDQTGGILLLRTNLPEQLGFAGGRHDLTSIIESDPA